MDKPRWYIDPLFGYNLVQWDSEDACLDYLIKHIPRLRRKAKENKGKIQPVKYYCRETENSFLTTKYVTLQELTIRKITTAKRNLI